MSKLVDTPKDTSTRVKAVYTTPTLIEYGSLAERTKIFGLNPEDLSPDSMTHSITSITF